mgnify:FL=1
MDSTAILDKKVRAESTKLCKNSGKCVDKGAGILSGEQFNVSPFCQEMQPSPTTKKPTLYGGMFDIISETSLRDAHLFVRFSSLLSALSLTT